MKRYILGLGFIAFLASRGSDNTTIQDTEIVEVTEHVEEKAYEIDFTWTAFKTEERVGVNGTFNDIKVMNYTEEGETLADKISFSTITIDGSTVNTNDPERDETLRTFFFDHLGGPIDAKFGELKDGVAEVTLLMNQQKAPKKFTYEILDENTINISGSIDLIQDFQAQKAYDELHQKCFDLHLGVTGTDVEINVTVKFL